MLDCAVIGGGPSGLSAALVLGRARRSVVVFDDNRPRNAATRHTHGFITRDGIPPGELRTIAAQELNRYPSILREQRRVTAVMPVRGGFCLQTEDGLVCHARKLLLATGLQEILPPVPDLALYYGSSLFGCPYCDGWELRDRPLVVIADNNGAYGLTRLAYQWSRNLLVCTNGSAEAFNDDQWLRLRSKGIAVSSQPIRGLLGRDGMLEAVQLADGTVSKREGGFVSPYWKQASPLGKKLGCALSGDGGLMTDGRGRTSVYGIYAAGDAAVVAPAQAVIAAGEGSRAAIAINADLIDEDF